MILVYITPAFENRFASNAIPSSGLYVSKIRKIAKPCQEFEPGILFCPDLSLFAFMAVSR